MPNLQLTPKRDLSSFRKIAIGTWRTAKDPSVYGSIELEVDEMLAYIEAFREQTGTRLTLTHVMARVVGAVMEELPDANAILRFNRIYLRSEISVFFQVVMKDPVSGQVDLSGVTVRDANTRSLGDISAMFQKAADKVRAGRDTEKEQTRQSFKAMPGWMTGWVLDLIGFLTYTLNLNMAWAGIPKDVFGSAMVTNIGSLGLDSAYVPLVPYSRVPLVIAMGQVTKVPKVDDETDAIRVAKVLRLHATFDHRILDGAHAAKMASVLKAWFADPWTHLDPIERPEISEPAADAAAARC